MEPVVIIYGATGAMGAATARQMKGKARRLHLVGRDPERLSAIGRELSSPCTCGDVTDPELFSSVAATRGFAMHTSVSMAKGAVSGLVPALAAELAPRIRVNAVAPSVTDTPLAARLLAGAEAAEAIARKHALKRIGTADDMARITAFLISPESDWITGQVIGVDGGRSVLDSPG